MEINYKGISYYRKKLFWIDLVGMIKNDKVYCDYCKKRIYRQRSLDFGPTARKKKKHFCNKECMNKYNSKYGTNKGRQRTRTKQICEICQSSYYANLNSRYCPDCRKLISYFRSLRTYDTLEDYLKYLSTKKNSRFYTLSRKILYIWRNNGGPVDNYGRKK